MEYIFLTAFQPPVTPRLVFYFAQCSPTSADLGLLTKIKNTTNLPHITMLSAPILARARLRFMCIIMGALPPAAFIKQGQSPIDSTHQAEPGASGRVRTNRQSLA